MSQSTSLSSLYYTTTSHCLSSLHTVMYVSRLLSQFFPPSPCPAVSKSSFCTSASLFLPCKEVHQYHFSGLHIYVLIYSICFSLSGFLHSLCTTGSRLIHLSSADSDLFLLWLSNTPFIYIPKFLYLFVSQWTSRLLPCPGYCK